MASKMVPGLIESIRRRPRSPGWLATGLAGLLGVGCATTKPAPDPMPQPRVTHRIKVSRHVSTSLSAGRADEILAGMGWVLRVPDGVEDTTCNVEFTREGELGVFAVGSGTINTAGDFLAVNSAPGRVKVVNQINWCGGFAPNIIGCTRLFNDSMIVVRHREDLEEILWLHEFGHAQGLEHRTSSTAVMNPTLGPNRRQVNAGECESFRWNATVASPIPRLPAAREP